MAAATHARAGIFASLLVAIMLVQHVNFVSGQPTTRGQKHEYKQQCDQYGGQAYTRTVGKSCKVVKDTKNTATPGKAILFCFVSCSWLFFFF